MRPPNGQRKSETFERSICIGLCPPRTHYQRRSQRNQRLEDHEFEKAYNKASNIAEKVVQHEGEKMDKFLEHFAKEIEQYTEHFGGKLFK